MARPHDRARRGVLGMYAAGERGRRTPPAGPYPVPWDRGEGFDGKAARPSAPRRTRDVRRRRAREENAASGPLSPILMAEKVGGSLQRHQRPRFFLKDAGAVPSPRQELELELREGNAGGNPVAAVVPRLHLPF